MKLCSFVKMAKPKAPQWWHGLVEILGMSDKQSALFWEALRAAQHPELVALRFRCDQFDTHLKKNQMDMVKDTLSRQRFLVDTWRPSVMVRTLEQLCRERLLSRKQSNLFMEFFLSCADKEGYWLTSEKR